MTHRMSIQLLERVERALPDGGIGAMPRSVHAEINLGARQSVWHALRELVAAGRARSEGPPSNKRYWRAKVAA